MKIRLIPVKPVQEELVKNEQKIEVPQVIVQTKVEEVQVVEQVKKSAPKTTKRTYNKTKE